MHSVAPPWHLTEGRNHVPDVSAQVCACVLQFDHHEGCCCSCCSGAVLLLDPHLNHEQLAAQRDGDICNEAIPEGIVP